MDNLLGKSDENDVKLLIKWIWMKQAEASASELAMELHQVDLKLDGPATYLSWSRRIRGALAGRDLEGYLTGEVEEPSDHKTAEWKIWRATNASLYTWLLNSMVQSIASTVDSIQSVKDIWTKLQRIYGWERNNMRVFQIYQEIDSVFQGDRTIQEYAIELESLWIDYDHFSPMTVCKDPKCKSREVFAQRRTMQFLKHLNPAFYQMRADLLAQTKIPTLDEAIATMMQEESRMKSLSNAAGLSGMRSALATSNPNPYCSYGETRKCYNCDKVGHLSRACPKPPREIEAGRQGQPGARGGRRGGRCGSY